MIALTVGLSISSTRAEYFSTRERAVNFPDFMPSCSSVIVISSSSKGLISGDAGLAGARARAAPSAGYMTVAAVEVTALWRKLRRVLGMAILRRELAAAAI